MLAEEVRGIVVMGRVQTDVPDRDVGVHRLKLSEGDNGADAVMSLGIQETDMQGQVNTDLSIVGAKHIQGISKIERFLIVVPSPVRIWIREVALTETMENPVFHAFADLMPIRG